MSITATFDTESNMVSVQHDTEGGTYKMGGRGLWVRDGDGHEPTVEVQRVILQTVADAESKRREAHSSPEIGRVVAGIGI